MKKLLIYCKDRPDSQSYCVKSVRVTADFIGIGKNGQINEQEFRKLAQDLIPDYSSIQIVNL
jgi:hypothetical protein